MSALLSVSEITDLFKSTFVQCMQSAIFKFSLKAFATDVCQASENELFQTSVKLAIGKALKRCQGSNEK